jgi:hypothetical protein
VNGQAPELGTSTASELIVLVPHLAGLAVERMSAAGRPVHVLARTCGSEAACTGRGVVSRRVHSSYQRQLADTASGGQEVLIDLPPLMS